MRANNAVKTLNSLLQACSPLCMQMPCQPLGPAWELLPSCYIPRQIPNGLCRRAGLVILSLPARYALLQSLALLWGWKDRQKERRARLADLNYDQERLRWQTSRKSCSQPEPKRQREHATLLLTPWWKSCLSHQLPLEARPGGVQPTIPLYQPLYLPQRTLAVCIATACCHFSVLAVRSGAQQAYQAAAVPHAARQKSWGNRQRVKFKPQMYVLIL